MGVVLAEVSYRRPQKKLYAQMCDIMLSGVVAGFSLRLLACEPSSAIAVVRPLNVAPNCYCVCCQGFRGKFPKSIYLNCCLFLKGRSFNPNPFKGSVLFSIMLYFTHKQLFMFFFLLLVQFCYVLLLLSIMLYTLGSLTVKCDGLFNFTYFSSFQYLCLFVQ